jgi:tetratricopeptide (TPR) repeat protein
MRELSDLLRPIPGPNPSGENTRYLGVFDRIKEARREEPDLPQGIWKNERKIADWNVVVELCSDTLIHQTKDLQIATWLTEGLLHTDGYRGLAGGLNLLRGLLDNFWSTVYPRSEDDEAELRAVPLEWLGSRLDIALKSLPLAPEGFNWFDADRQLTTGSIVVAEGTMRTHYRARVEKLNSCLAALEELDASCASHFEGAGPRFDRLRASLKSVKCTLESLIATTARPCQDNVEEPLSVAVPPLCNPDAAPARPTTAVSGKERSLRASISALLKLSEERLSRRQFADAIQILEAALQLDCDNAELKRRLDETRALDHQAGTASALLKEGRGRYNNQDLKVAHERVSAALRCDPQNQEAIELLKTIQREMQRKERIEDAARRHEADVALTRLDGEGADSRLRGGRIDEATVRLHALEAEFPDNEEVSKLLKYAEIDLEAKRYQEAVSNAAETARTLLDKGHLEQAMTVLREATQRYPSESDLQSLLSQAQEEQSARMRTRDAVPALDHVHFTITTVSNLERGRSFELYFWVHLNRQRRAVIERAMRALGLGKPEEMVVKSEGPVLLARGTIVSARISLAGLTLDPCEKSILWSGETGCASFVVPVPPTANQRQYHGIVSIRVNSCEVARMDFLLRMAGRSGRVPAKLKRHATAFASYASEDRDAVIARLHCMQNVAPWLKVLMDVVDLRSGELWEKQLRQAIRESDVFYLFWCSHSRASKWVDREWRYAYEQRGLEFIDPVPLERSKDAPPPDELKSKHFNDLWTELNSKGHCE